MSNSSGRAFSVIALFLLLLMSGSMVNAQMNDSGFAEYFRWRNIGPANMSGRIADIECMDDDFSYVIVGSAGGGVWKSVNAGTTWEPIFDEYETSSIGDIAIYQKDRNLIWVATGESNVRNSVSWGNGIYKSTDGGDSFEHMGLEKTHHIARVITHPTNPEIVYVAAKGRLWGYNEERGVYKTEDGGNSWKKLKGGLPDDGKVGAIDLAVDSKNPDIMYAAMWDCLRTPYNFTSGGENGGIYKTTDGGNSWKKLTNGLPEGQTGRIGLAVYRKNPKIVMAMVEHSYRPVRRFENREKNPDYEDMTKLGTGVYRSEDGGETWEYVNRYNNRPFYYSQIRINPLNDQKVYLLTTRLMKSDDGGKTFSQAGPNIHVDFHAMWLSPKYENIHYATSDGGVHLSYDDGKTYDFLDNYVIGQFYAIGVDMRDPYYVYGGLQDNGSWGGPSNSRDGAGILTDHWYVVGGGDGFYTEIDPTDWRTVYVESQGGNIRRVDALTRESKMIKPNKESIVNWDQYVTPEMIKMNEDAGYSEETAFRFNWNMPILISPHNPHTLYIAGNVVFKSVDRGDTWKIISSDLSTMDPVRMKRKTGGITDDITGAETNTCVITLSESHIKPGVIWAGTDDGLVWISRDDGASWKNITKNIKGVKEGLFAERIEASHFEVGTAYLVFDGHRSDVFEPFVYVTTDFGENWTKINGNLPENEVTRVIREDLVNPNLLFLGTETGIFVSVDRGTSWEKFMNNLPTVPVHDIEIHPRENDLVVGTHGRGIWICDNISALQQMNDDVKTAPSYLFDQRRMTKWQTISRGGSRGHKFFRGPNPPKAAYLYYHLGEGVEDVVLTISDVTGEKSRTFEISGDPGINRYSWNMQFNPPELTGREEGLVKEIKDTEDRREKRRLANKLRDYLRERGAEFSTINRQTGRVAGPVAKAGLYKITLEAGGETTTKVLEIRSDPILKK